MWIWIPILAIPVVGPAIVAWKTGDEVRRTLSEDPCVWERQIRAFEKKERKEPTAKGSVVFDRSLFRFDRIHLNKKGYARWAQILRPKLLAQWRQQLH